MLDRRDQREALAQRNALPGISFTRQVAIVGLMMSYGPDIGWMYRQAGGQVARILVGAKPADIPEMQSVRFESVINIRTAKRLGLAISPAFLASVDEVVE